MLKLSNKDLRFVEFYHQAQNLFLSEMDKEKEPFQWAHFYAHPFYKVCLSICTLHMPAGYKYKQAKEHKEREKSLEWAVEKIKQKRPFLSSYTLRKAGIPNGARMGELLKEGEKIAINRNLRSEELIIEILRKHPLWT